MTGGHGWLERGIATRGSAAHSVRGAAKPAVWGVVLLTLAALGFGGAPAALASPPTVTLSGEGRDGYSPDSTNASAGVNATLSGGLASGSLETGGKVGDFGGTWFAFRGNVTCMVVEGNQVTVGAFGTAS